MSLQGVQTKLSVRLSIKESRFVIVDRGGTYILKPQVDAYEHVPENEVVTMRMAVAAGVEVPLHGLADTKGGDRDDFLVYYARERLQMTPGAVDMVARSIADALPEWYDLLERPSYPLCRKSTSPR